MVLLDSLLFTSATLSLSDLVSLIIGAILLLEKSSAIGFVFGTTNIIGPGSISMAYPIIFSSISVFPTCDDAATAIRCILGSVNASIISFRYGVLFVFHLPGSALFSADSHLYLSAHSVTVICSGGLK